MVCIKLMKISSPEHYPRFIRCSQEECCVFCLVCSFGQQKELILILTSVFPSVTPATPDAESDPNVPLLQIALDYY